jgi:hypothetical protein
LDEGVDRRAFTLGQLDAGEQPAALVGGRDVVQLIVGPQEQQADAAADATAASGGVEDLVQHHLKTELDRVQTGQPVQRVDDALRVAGHGGSLPKRHHRRCCASFCRYPGNPTPEPAPEARQP